MNTTSLLPRVALLALGLALGWRVADAADATRSAIPANQRPAVGSKAGSPSRGILPDPTLLDGSKQAAEKKSEIGMIGDFELPGDENAQNGRVGGSGGGQQQEQGNGGGGMPQGQAGAGGGPQQQVAKAGSGQDATAQAGGGTQDPKGNEKPGGGAQGDPNAKAEGIQVAQLGGEPSGQQEGGSGQKPAPMAIGDAAMRIPQQTPNMTVIGAQQAASQNTQVYEKPTGTGGKAPTGVQGPNRTEKGRTIPAGL